MTEEKVSIRRYAVRANSDRFKQTELFTDTTPNSEKRDQFLSRARVLRKVRERNG